MARVLADRIFGGALGKGAAASESSSLLAGGGSGTSGGTAGVPATAAAASSGGSSGSALAALAGAFATANKPTLVLGGMGFLAFTALAVGLSVGLSARAEAASAATPRGPPPEQRAVAPGADPATSLTVSWIIPVRDEVLRPNARVEWA
jgi:hypothetical protein